MNKVIELVDSNKLTEAKELLLSLNLQNTFQHHTVMAVIHVMNGDKLNGLKSYINSYNIQPNKDILLNIIAITKELGMNAIDFYYAYINTFGCTEEILCGLMHSLIERRTFDNFNNLVKTYKFPTYIYYKYAINGYFNTGMDEEALTLIDECLQLNLTNDQRVIMNMYKNLLIPNTYNNQEEIDTTYNKLNNTIKSMINSNMVLTNVNSLSDDFFPLSLELSYIKQNNSQIFRNMNRLYRKLCPQLTYTSQHCYDLTKKANKIRIGFLSTFYVANTIIVMTHSNYIQRMSSDIFETFVFFIGEIKDNYGRNFWNNVQNPVKLVGNFETDRKTIDDLKLDILIYTDIGMGIYSYMLACSRLANIQCATYGHPETTGIDTIDYYITNRYFENDLTISQSHYTEKLLVFDSLATYYIDPTIRENYVPVISLSEKLGNVYACLQTLFKINDTMDMIFDKILDKDNSGIILLLDCIGYTDKIKLRMKKTMKHSDRVQFIKHLVPTQKYLEKLSEATVILDPYPVCGACTSLDALSIGKPIVTLPTEILRGRHTYGYYKKIGFMELVATDINNYVDIALKLAMDKEYNKYASKTIMDNKYKLFNDEESVNEWNSKMQELYLNHLK